MRSKVFPTASTITTLAKRVQRFMTLTDTTPISTTVDCSACGETYNKHLITFRSGEQLAEPAPAGWFLPYKHFGYYNGFDDDIGVLIGGDTYEQWWLCHDCVVKFFTTFPLLAEKIGDHGFHPNNTDTGEGIEVPSCCRWCWTTLSEVLYLGDGNGGWRKAHQ